MTTHSFRVNRFRKETLAPAVAFTKSFYSGIDTYQGQFESQRAELDELRQWVATLFAAHTPEVQLAMLRKHGGDSPGEWILVQPTQGE